MYAIAKRLTDVAIASLVLATASFVIAALALLIRLDSEGPVFYKAARVGRGGRLFRMLKFRTMVVNADKTGPSSTSGDDPRITRVGRLIRGFKLDEIPQFVNVLMGHMSIVGPRPEVKWVVDQYTAEQRQLLTLKPGVVDYGCLWNRNEGEILRGSADPDRDYLEKIAPTKLKLSLEYLKDRSLWVDLRIMIATAAAVALKKDPVWCLPIDRVSLPDLTASASCVSDGTRPSYE